MLNKKSIMFQQTKQVEWSNKQDKKRLTKKNMLEQKQINCLTTKNNKKYNKRSRKCPLAGWNPCMAIMYLAEFSTIKKID